jgi:hypothetical protein
MARMTQSAVAEIDMLKDLTGLPFRLDPVGVEVLSNRLRNQTSTTYPCTKSV